MRRGFALLELLVGATLALISLAALAAAIATGGRLLASAGTRGEAEDTVALAADALVFDVRRAGFTLSATELEPILEARDDRLTLASDLDGDGNIDATSEEHTTHACALAQQRLSRVAGRQSLPLADNAVRCAFVYRDAAGALMPVAPGGLSAAERGRVRVVELQLELLPPGLRTSVARRIVVALRVGPSA